MVDHKDVDLIAFTGSREVGLKIWEVGRQYPPWSARAEAGRFARWAAKTR